RTGCDDPNDGAQPGENTCHQWSGSLQKPVRIPKRQLDRQRVADTATQSGSSVFGRAFRDLDRIRRNIRLQKVGRVELRKELNNLALRRSVVAELLHHVLPDLVDGAFTVHLADEEIDRRGEAVGPAGNL